MYQLHYILYFLDYFNRTKVFCQLSHLHIVLKWPFKFYDGFYVICQSRIGESYGFINLFCSLVTAIQSEFGEGSQYHVICWCIKIEAIKPLPFPLVGQRVTITWSHYSTPKKKNKNAQRCKSISFVSSTSKTRSYLYLYFIVLFD